MSYNKFIRYGDTFELYEYEKQPRTVARRRRVSRKRELSTDGESVHASGENTVTQLSEQAWGKRQDNARHTALAFRRVVASNLSRTQPPLLLTLTYKENITDLSIGYKNYRSFVQALRYKFGKAFRYICVPEFQTRGAVHFHALVWGLPADVFLQERKTRTIARLWGMGFVFIKQTDGDGKLSSYLAKYMSKAFTDRRLKNQKAYVASRNILRPTFGKGFSPLWPVLDDYVGENNVPVTDRTYSTHWLGECRHRIFRIPTDTDE